MATITCPHCQGHGVLPLTGVYADTLALLRGQRGEVTGAEVGRLAGCSNEAACNRLAALEKHGLATSRRYGRKRLYKAKARTG